MPLSTTSDQALRSPEVVTLTMNPALDVSTAVAQVMPAHKLRCEAAQTHPGGGGINVARVIHRFGTPCLALFPAGGITGQAISTLLGAEGVSYETVPIAGESRESFSVHEQLSGQDYRFVLPGPELSETEWRACLTQLESLATPPHFLVASGSLPPGAPEDFYAQLAHLCRKQGIRLALDASGAPLRAGLTGGVDIVKPSLRELQELTGQSLHTAVEQVQAARTLIQQGSARIVALSLGEHGAMLVTATEAWCAPAVPVTVASTIGAGDSFLAGLIWSLSQRHPLEQAFAYAMAAATAALLSRGTALCSPSDVQRLLPLVKIGRC